MRRSDGQDYPNRLTVYNLIKIVIYNYITFNNMLEQLKNLPRVENMTSLNSIREIPNQFIIKTPQATIFQSYNSIIVLRTADKTYLDEKYWDCSRTTSKYRNEFTGLTTKETKEKIKNGEFELIDLNQ